MNNLFQSLLFVAHLALLFSSTLSQPSLTNLDPISASTQTGCSSFPDYFNWYSVQSCPMKTGAANIYPVNLTNEVFVFAGVNTGVDNNTYSRQTFPFNLTIYGYSSNRVAISNKGVLMFGQYPINRYNQPIPSYYWEDDHIVGRFAGPLIEPLQGDLYLLSGSVNDGNGVVSYISVGTLGTAPNLVCVIRYYRVTAFTARADTNRPIFSFDVLLYQNSSSFEIRYYRLDVPSINATNTQFPLSVGTQSLYIPYIALFSSSTNFTAISTTLLGNSLTFSPVPPAFINNVPNPALLDPIPSSNHSDCLSYSDTMNLYNVQACPMYSGNQIMYPVNLRKENILQSNGGGNSDSVLFLAFPFTIYGFVSSRIDINTNGILEFGNVRTSSNDGNGPIPDNVYINGAGPVIFPLRGDFYVLSSEFNINSYISTGYLGSSPNLVFVIRYSRVSYYYPRDNPPLLFTFDIFLYQNSTTFEIRYYRLDFVAASSTAISVGIQGNTAELYVALFSQSSNYTVISSALLGNTLSFTPVVQNAAISSTGASFSSGALSTAAIPISSSSTAAFVSDNLDSSNKNNNNNNLSDGAIAGIVIGVSIDILFIRGSSRRVC